VGGSARHAVVVCLWLLSRVRAAASTPAVPRCPHTHDGAPCPLLRLVPPPPPRSIHDYQCQLKALGQDVTGNRGKMLHLILTLCQKVEKAFNKIVDGGEGGGWRVCTCVSLGAGQRACCRCLGMVLPRPVCALRSP
jgi:hypothetical protein